MCLLQLRPIKRVQQLANTEVIASGAAFGLPPPCQLKTSVWPMGAPWFIAAIRNRQPEELRPAFPTEVAS